MKVWVLMGVLALLAGAVGCQRGMPPDWEHRQSQHRWMIDHYNTEAAENAILAEHTLYGHHFVTGAPVLNNLGRRDLEVLAEHHREYPGKINVRRGETGEQLYEQRLEAVREHLVQAGVDLEAVTLADDLPGGPGRPSVRDEALYPEITDTDPGRRGGATGGVFE